MSDEYSGYSYDDSEQGGSSPSQNDSEELEQQEYKQRISFYQETGVTLQCGQTGTIYITPGPGNAFDIRFSVHDSDSKASAIVLSIRDGQCKINADETIVLRQSAEAPARAEFNDPAALYEFRKL